MTIYLPHELEIEFRHLTRQKYGYKQSKLSHCPIKAIQEWCEKQ